MDKKLYIPCRVILLISALCLLAILSNGKVIAGVPGIVPGGVYDNFFDEPVGNVLANNDMKDEPDTVVELTNTITVTGIYPYTVVLSDFTFVSDRYSVRLMPNSFVSMDIYQSHPNAPDVLEPLAKGVNAIVSEDRWLKNGINGQMIIALFYTFGNETISEEDRTLKAGYNLVVKFNPVFEPGFYCLRSITNNNPISLIRGTVK